MTENDRSVHAESAATGVLAERDDLTAATRRFLAALRRTQASAEERADAAARIDELATLLERTAAPGRLCETGHSDLDPPREIRELDPFTIFPWSPAVGERNPIAPEVDFAHAEDGSIIGTVRCSPVHNGPPWDVTHGGIIALLYDELLGLTGIASGAGGFTGRLTISYRAPTPLLAPFQMRGWIDRVEGRKTFVRGEMHHDGVLLSEAEGLFIRPADRGALVE